MTEYLIDTSVLVDQYKNEIPLSKIYQIATYKNSISIISVFEMNKYLRKTGKFKNWNEISSTLKKYTIFNIDFEICELASELSNSRGLSAADAFIYATALKNDLRFLTRDADFKKMEKAEVI